MAQYRNSALRQLKERQTQSCPSRFLSDARFTIGHIGPELHSCGESANDAVDLTIDQHEFFQAYLQGVDVNVLAQMYNLSRARTLRVIAEIRTRNILSQKVTFVDAPVFHEADADRLILTAPPVDHSKSARPKAPSGLTPYLASLYSAPLLTRDEEVYYFRKMNYLKFVASERQKSLDPATAVMQDLDQIEWLIQQADDVKKFLISCNLRLVVSIAKKRINYATEFFETVSDGNISLIRAIEKFDFTRGFKFSTYASWAIMKNYARSVPLERIRLERFRTGSEEVLRQSFDRRSQTLGSERANYQQHEALMRLLSQLPQREKEVIVFRFGLYEGTVPQTLAQIGVKLGVTKERIRQIEGRAIDRLRKIAEAEHFDVPGM